MIIDSVYPEFVGARSTLAGELTRLCREEGLRSTGIAEWLAVVPPPLIDAPAFFDVSTGLWRYEFGRPYVLNGELIYGTHMWVPVDHLHIAIRVATARVPEWKRAAFLARLADPRLHWETLAEMMPGVRLAETAITDFEVSGLGVGNRTIDWLIQQDNRRTLLDAKSRSADFLQQAAMKDVDGYMPPPEHDPALLFRSVESKFQESNPDVTLQGAWISTHIKQNKIELNRVFALLNSAKVHFVIFGDWDSDVCLQSRREQDRQYLLELFGAQESDRFTFTP